MFGSRKTTGAMRMPATAPIADAMPQPSPVIMPTRMPTSRADSGLAAAARIASPTRVYLKNANNSMRTTKVITIMPAWCAPIRPSPKSDALPNGSKRLDREVPDEAREAVEDRKQRDEDDDVAQHRRILDRLKTVRPMMKPPTKEMPIVRTNASQ